MQDFGGIKRLLITGATGFIGRALVDAAQTAGIHVTVLSRAPAHAQKILGAVTAHCCASEIADDAQFDAIVHLAGANVIAWPWTAGTREYL